MNADWVETTLGEISDFKGGSQPPKSQFIYEPQEGYVRMLQIRDFKSDAKACYIPKTKKTNFCSSEDIMIGRYGASVGQIHRGKSGAYNVALIRTIPDLTKIDKDFFYYYLTSDLFQKPLATVSARSAQAGFSKPDIAPFEFLLPPLEEQKRIVAVLDGAFEGLDRARAHTETNLQNARDLFASRLLEAVTKSDASWTEHRFGDLINFLNGFAFKSKDAVPDSDTQLIRMGNLYQNELNLDRKPSFYPNEYIEEYDKFEVLAGDIIISLTGTVGKKDYGFAVRIPEVSKRLLLNQRIAKFVDIDEKKLNKDFLMLFLHSEHFLEMLYESANGTRQANLSTNEIKNFTFRFPPVEMQASIARELESLKTQCETLKSSYKTKLTDLDDLRQSLLQKAFAGELT